MPLQVVITFKTLLLAVALFLLTWAVVSIRDTLLIVAVGVFLGLVFEGPVRLVERKTSLGRGMSATVSVIGALVALTLLGLVLLKPILESLQSFLKDLPQTVDQLQNSDELGFLGDTGAADNVQSGAQSASNAVPDALGALVGFAGSLASFALSVFLITFICLFLLCEVRRPEGGARERAAEGAGRRLAAALGAGHDDGLALGDRRRGHRDDRRHRPGPDRVAARVELRGRARA